MQNADNNLPTARVAGNLKCTTCPQCGGPIVALNPDSGHSGADALKCATTGDHVPTHTETPTDSQTPDTGLMAAGGADAATLKAIALAIVARMPADFHRQMVTGSEIAKWLDLPEEDLLKPVWTTSVSKQHPAAQNMKDLTGDYEPAPDYSPGVMGVVKQLIDGCPCVF